MPLQEYGLDLILYRSLAAWVEMTFSLVFSFEDVKSGLTIADLTDKIINK